MVRWYIKKMYGEYVEKRNDLNMKLLSYIRFYELFKIDWISMDELVKRWKRKGNWRIWFRKYNKYDIFNIVWKYYMWYKYREISDITWYSFGIIVYIIYKYKNEYNGRMEKI